MKKPPAAFPQQGGRPGACLCSGAGLLDLIQNGGFFGPVVAVVGTVDGIHDIPHVIELSVVMSAVAQGGPVRMKPVADDSGEIILNIGEGVDPYAGEDPETLALEVLELWAGLMPVVPVGAPWG